MEYFQEVWPALASAPLANWVMGGEFLVIMVLLFLVWRQGRWMAKVNNHLIDSKELVTRRLAHSNEAVVVEMTKLVNRAVAGLADARDKGTEPGR